MENPKLHDMFDTALRHHRAGRLVEAEKIYRQILSDEPHHADSLHLLGVIGHRAGQLAAASELIGSAIRIRNDVPAYHGNFANVLKDQGLIDEAVAHYRFALKLDPRFADAHYNLGRALQDQGRPGEASEHYERALELQLELVPALINLGNIRKDEGRLGEAVACYERAIALDPENTTARYNLALVCKDQGKPQEAIEHFERMLALKPDDAGGHNNLGVLRREQGRIEEALHHFRTVTANKTDHAEARVNEAMLLLLMGDLTEGWRAYEWRWRVKGARPLATGRPLWDGAALDGKTILLHGEQGLGDCIQFVRYAPLVKKRGARVVLKCPSVLARLFRNMEAVDEVIAEGEPFPAHDCHAPLMSLPMIFGTTIDTIPNSVPYLSAAPDEIATWAARLESAPGLKVGLVWAGHARPDHPNAHAVDRRRSMTIAQFAPLASVSGVRFISLQKGSPVRREEFPPGLNIVDPMDGVRDFADTAALVANLDLVIGVDTSVIHLAGALGKPVWALSRFDGCWRWLENRDDSPWYPTLRLFRQESPGDWDSVIARVRDALVGFDSRKV